MRANDRRPPYAAIALTPVGGAAAMPTAPIQATDQPLRTLTATEGPAAVARSERVLLLHPWKAVARR
jgi:hypothetical protein